MHTRSFRPAGWSRSAVLLLASIAAVVHMPRPALAASLTWTGAVSDRAEIAGNWSPAQIPAAADDLNWGAAGGIFIMFGLPAVQTSRSWTITESKQIHTLKAHTITQNIRLTGFGALILSSIDSIRVNGDIEHESFGTLTVQAGCPVVGADSVRFSAGSLTISGLNSRVLAQHVLIGGNNLIVGLGARLVAAQSLALLPGAQIVLGGTTSSITAPALTVPSGSNASLFEGRLSLAGELTLDGGLSMGAGARVDASTVRVLASGSILGSGTIAAALVLDQSSLTSQLGKLTVGNALNPAGVDLEGSVEVKSQSELECLSASPVVLPSSVLINNGTLRSPSGFVLEDGSMLARGLIAGDLDVVGGEFSGMMGFLGVPTRATIQGNWSQDVGAIRTLYLFDSGSTWVTDSLEITGQAAPGGTLDIYYDDSAGPPSNPIPFLFYASRSAARTFDAVNLNGVPVTNELQILYLADHAEIVFGGSVAVEGQELRPAALDLAGRSGGVAWLELSLPAASDVKLELHDVAGRVVASVHNGPLAAGTHRFELSGGARTDALPSGVYFARAAVRNETGDLAIRTAKVVFRR